MKRIHQTLESRTGGLVIWRSGSSVVLYRGMTYKLPCVQSYTKQNQVNTKSLHSSKDIVGDLPPRIGLKDSVRTTESLVSNSTRYLKDLSEEEIMDLSELNYLLDELGPRFKDWSGREPLPVDADLLPSVVPGYKRPFRLLPYGTRHGLRDKDMTFYRRTARTMPPHFALGRSRELQGLAMAMILTGGTQLTRNRDYIVFYRVMTFASCCTKTLDEAQKLAALPQDEEDQARWKASTLIHSNAKANNGLLVAGTLAETMAATSQWGNQPSSQDIEKLKRDAAVFRHASLVRYLEKKLALALKYHISDVTHRIEKLKSELEDMKAVEEIDEVTFYSRVDNASSF
ncbi:hypothetical protein LOK49_LG06G02166 [Camellia lanceoleosa]|uniref:Uncharacterized protein n=1 Tax=Camellia lanceoleosa TaxID=1840588 RepID=A0ACC0HBN1_9ERIC|nr:hypothetical protein LOK49_LG06G02166 [Camellia lanceoleosa]